MAMFRRKAPRNLRERLARLWPRKGWLRAMSYMLYRLRRLPDPPHRIARGVAAGIFASFTPFYGLHFIIAGTVAWGIGGNIVASAIGTAIGNPLTFPFIASISVELGLWILGQPGHMPPGQILAAFARASLQISENVAALFGSGEMEWSRLALFFRRVFLPYLVGGILPGLITAIVGHLLTFRLVLAYQALRSRRRQVRFLRRQGAEGAAAGPGGSAAQKVTPLEPAQPAGASGHQPGAQGAEPPESPPGAGGPQG